MDEFVNHKLVRDYMNNDPQQKQCVRKYIRHELQKKEENKVTVTEVTPRTEVEPIRSGDHQEKDELLRVLAESEKDVARNLTSANIVSEREIENSEEL